MRIEVDASVRAGSRAQPDGSVSLVVMNTNDVPIEVTLRDEAASMEAEAAIADDGGLSYIPLCELYQMDLTRTASNATIRLEIFAKGAEAVCAALPPATRAARRECREERQCARRGRRRLTT